MIYHFKSLVLVRKGRAFYTTLYQEVFFGNPGGGGSLKVNIYYYNERYGDITMSEHESFQICEVLNNKSAKIRSILPSNSSY